MMIQKIQPEQIDIHAGDLKATPVDADELLLADSADAYKVKRVPRSAIGGGDDKVAKAGDVMTGDLRGTDFIGTRSGAITRDGNGRISQVALTGGRTITVTRDGNGRVSSVADGTNTWTVTRDGNGRISSWAVT